MSRIGVCGWGAVSPAGWGAAALGQAVAGRGMPCSKLLEGPQGAPVPTRMVPSPPAQPGFLRHPRLRRTSPITHYTVAAALEALGSDAGRVTGGQLRLGIVYCVTCGCVNYTRRFFGEALQDPSTASPIVFPETVFNAPASHLAAFLNSGEINYTLAGDQGIYVQGIALAADWLAVGRVDGCLVIGAEEMDWLTATAARLFEPGIEVSEGAGALYLKRLIADGLPQVEVESITDVCLYTREQTREQAAARCREQIAVRPGDDLLCDSLCGFRRSDRAEASAWEDWPRKRISVKTVFGEAFTAGAAWQCVAAMETLHSGDASSAIANVVGSNQQAIAARFIVAAG